MMLKTMAMIVGLSVSVAGCHVFKQHPEVKSVDATVIQKTAKLAPTLQELDLRVTDIERRMAAARAYRAKHPVLEQ